MQNDFGPVVFYDCFKKPHIQNITILDLAKKSFYVYKFSSCQKKFLTRVYDPFSLKLFFLEFAKKNIDCCKSLCFSILFRDCFKGPDIQNLTILDQSFYDCLRTRHRRHVPRTRVFFYKFGSLSLDFGRSANSPSQKT